MPLSAPVSISGGCIEILSGIEEIILEISLKPTSTAIKAFLLVLSQLEKEQYIRPWNDIWEYHTDFSPLDG